MMFLVGGVPRNYHDDFVPKIRRTLAQDHYTSLPMFRGDTTLSDEYYSDLLLTAARYIARRPNAVAGGFGVILLLRPWDRAAKTELFLPFAICATAIVQEDLYHKGAAARRAANAYAAHAT